jgi:hypothetical protein
MGIITPPRTDKDVIDELHSILTRSGKDYRWLASKTDWSYDKVRNLFNNYKNLSFTDYNVLINTYKDNGLLNVDTEIINNIQDSIISFSCDATSSINEIQRSYLNHISNNGYISIEDRDNLVDLISTRTKFFIKHTQDLVNTIMKLK